MDVGNQIGVFMKSRYTLEADGFCARWFEGTVRRDYVVIVLPGTGTAEENAIKQFGYFNAAGYSVLLVAHSVWKPELPKDPISVPVEWIQSAVKILKCDGYAHIALFGLSFGARYALLAATELSEIEVVIAASPYDYISEAVAGLLRPLDRSTHSLCGKDLPYLRIEVLHRCLPLELFKLLTNRDYGLHNMLRYGYDSCTEQEDARIKVENIKADVLLLAPQFDDCWPSEQAVPRIEQLIRQANPSGYVKAIIYPNGNHILATDLDATPDRKKKMQRFLKEGKGDVTACDLTRKESIQEVLRFLERWRTQYA